MKKSISAWVAILVSLLPVAYLAGIWNSLPQTVPLHFTYDMKPDRMGDKSEMWAVTGILAGVSILVYFLLNNIHHIDPKRRGRPQTGAFDKLAIGLVVFLAALNFIIISSVKGSFAMQNLLFPLLGLLFAFLGNYMNNIKPNYFAGFRLPWTLSDDDNWRKTHHLAGRVWFGGGLVLVLASLLLPVQYTFPLFITVVVVMSLIPVIYSYRLFKNKTAA
ncbi:MAG TPA: SdpI family protein [Flavisolibacter sp.]|jgi:uncharacterized membrane protein|nr:SdpI family protein [Flavisolibacter sp.]